MAQASKVAIDVNKIKMAIQAGIPLSITTYTLPHEMEIYMKDVLTAFLNELNQEQMVEYLNYCLEELINNAKKANTKRVYFEDKHLDITKQHGSNLIFGKRYGKIRVKQRQSAKTVLCLKQLYL